MTKTRTIKKRVGSYSLAKKQEAAIEYAINGSLTKTSQSLDIPKSTLCTWKKGRIHDRI